MRWSVFAHGELGPTFRAQDGELAIELFMDGPEWVQRTWAGRVVLPYAKVTLAQVVEIAPELRAEAIGLTRLALDAEHGRIDSQLREALGALEQGDGARVVDVLDDLRTWGTMDLLRELEEAGADA